MNIKKIIIEAKTINGELFYLNGGVEIDFEYEREEVGESLNPPPREFKNVGNER